jgi:CHAT domain-containing protein
VARFSRFGAVIGSALIALLLAESSGKSADSPNPSPSFPAGAASLHALGKSFFASGKFIEARTAFESASAAYSRAANYSAAAMDLNNAGGCDFLLMQYRDAAERFHRAHEIAETAQAPEALAASLNNLANLYIHSGQPEEAIRTVEEAAHGLALRASPKIRARLFFQSAIARAQLRRFEEGAPFLERAAGILLDENDLDAVALFYSNFALEYLNAGRPADAEPFLNESLRLIRTHRLPTSSPTLVGLARLRAARGDAAGAARYFAAALKATDGLTPLWTIYAARGRYRLQSGDLPGALDDFRAARAIVTRLRLEMIPADQDRVAMQSGIAPMLEGIVDAGNRLALRSGNRSVLEETFDAAEQDRVWSLRALMPAGTADWRDRLPERYWELLARFQQAALSEHEAASKAARAELRSIETAAGAGSSLSPVALESPLAHLRRTLDRNTALFAFHISNTSSWLWVVEDSSVYVFPLPPAEEIRTEVEEFNHLLREGLDATPLGQRLYQDLFGSVPETVLDRAHWLIEPDGPLFDLPFAALATSRAPKYLIEKTSLALVPSALLTNRVTIPASASFLGIGDPIYNSADPRNISYSGQPVASRSLPRLPGSALEIRACARAWNSPGARLLTGSDAELEPVRAALKESPGILHFATHVIASPEDYRSGLIALSIGRDGIPSLLGPREIVSRPQRTLLVVMNGCYSGQGEALPGVGLMGLTRAWIGAGALAVVATRWDIPDSASQPLLAAFYSALRAAPERGVAAALREAQLSRIATGRRRPAEWSGYFLLSRMT